MQYKFRRLSLEEEQKLRKNINNGLYIGITACLLFVLLGGGIFYLFWNMDTIKFKYIVAMIAGIGMSLMGLFFIYKIIEGTNLQKKELAKGEKAVFNGIVTNKRESNTVITDDTDKDGMFKRTERIKRWYVAVDDDEYEVEKSLHDKLQVGNKVEVHLAPDSGYLLNIFAKT